MDWVLVTKVVAGLVLIDQAVGPLTNLPSSDTIIVACIGALTAPRLKRKRESQD